MAEPVLHVGSAAHAADWGIPVSAILDRLAAGLSAAEVARDFPAATIDESDALAALQEAARLAGGARLSLPAAAAFRVRLRGLHAFYLGTGNRSGSHQADPDAVALAAQDGLHELAHGASALGRFDLMAAAAYGAALARQQELSASEADEPPLPLLGQLPADDRRLVEEFMTYHRQLSGWTNAPWSLESRIERWSRFVQQVTDGYPWIVEEYTNALDGRDILEDAVSMVSPAGRSPLSSVVDPIDRRFEQATEPAPGRLRERRWEARRWWWQRAPLILQGDLARDFRLLPAGPGRVDARQGGEH